MTEDFKKGLATGLAIGGMTVVKGGNSGMLVEKKSFTNVEQNDQTTELKVTTILSTRILIKDYINT